VAQAARSPREGALLGRPRPIAAAVALLAAALVACGARVESAPRWTERVVAARRTTPGAPPPLLVLLHGLGGDESDLLPIAERLDPRFQVASVRAPREHRGGRAWFALAWRADGSVVPDRTQARESLAALVRWIEAAPARLGTDPARVYLLGFSQGAMMGLGALRAAPKGLAGVVALSGHWSDDLFEEAASDDAGARIPLFVAHGTRDEVLPISSGHRVREFFRPRQRELTYREYPIGHLIAPDELADVAAWLTRRLDAP
jgi:phospholipase/carboxylesterase